MFRRFAFVPLLLIHVAAFAQSFPNEPSVSTSGNAEVLVEPDQVEFTIGVEIVHGTLSVAKELNDAAVAKTIAVAKRNGVEPSSIQTDYISIDPNYYDSDGRSRATPVNYVVRRSVVIVSKDVAGFERLLTQLVEAGANHVNGIRFLTTKLRAHRDEARRLATQAALEKAQLLAKSLGRNAGKVLQIAEATDWWSSSYSSWYGRWNSGASTNVSQNASPVGGTPSSGDGPLAPGRIAVKATVNCVFALD
ncbi:MAG TPA: SIMPL domain-containing protein [Thermoanaerobaculia bacterium]